MKKNNIEKSELDQIANSMNKAAKKLYSFLENLLEWSRSQMGGIQFYPMKIEIKDAINRAFSVLNEIAVEKSIYLINSVDKVFYVNSDNNALNTILRNLISNSIKFTKIGGTISVGIESETDDFVTVFVKDSGVGISLDNIANLFRLDTKVTTTGTGNEQGSGLGLLLVKEFVEKNGGSLHLESELNIGTTVYFTLRKFSE